MKKNSHVDGFVENAKSWREEMIALRAVLAQTSLVEDFKWRLPCYASDGHNIVIIQPFKNALALMFFKGMLLKDTKKLLVPNGPNSKSASRLEFHSVDDVKKRASVIKSYIKEALKIEASGLKVEKTKPKAAAIPAELKAAFAKNAKLKSAFAALTPGRQRAYLLHFTGAKQSATRTSRIRKFTPQILKGKGMMDR